MKAIKHFTILMLALCCSYFANAQCPIAITDTVHGNSIVANVPNWTVSGFEFAWYLDGNLVQAANANTGYTYQNVTAGTHRICMYSYDNNTNFCDSVCESVAITSCGTLTAQWTYSAGTNDTVRFVAYDTNSLAHHIWNFGDGNDGTGTTVTHIYSVPGTYHVCFYSYIPGTVCSDSLCENVVVPTACGVASFASYILNDSTIRGYSTSTGTNDSSVYVWSVYNNATGNLVQSSSTGHTSAFLSNSLPIGSYRVCLQLYNNTQVLCSSFCDTVQVLRCSSLTAAWQSGSVNSDTIHFYNSTNPTGTVYAWTFGDGSTSTSSNPTHIYSQQGTYTACLIVSNPALNCKDTLCENITVGNPNACGTASFEYYILNDSTIRTYSNSTGTNDSSVYVWNVYNNSNGNLVQSSSTGHTPYFLSNSLPIGSYRVCLQLYNNTQVLCSSFCDTVQVLRCSSISNTWHYTTSTTSDTASFTIPTNNPSGTTYVWTFGDGSTSTTSPAVTHIYSQSGTYTVCLIASNPALTCHDTVCQSITVGSNTTSCGVASFQYYILNDSTIRGYSTSTGTNDSSVYVWNIYNSAGQLIQSDPTGHTYYFLSNALPIGSYRVCLQLYNNNQVLCSSFCDTVQVLRCSSLNAAWQRSTHNSDTITFYGPTNDSSGTVYAWTFGDGGTSSDPTITHIYAQAGTYNVCLVVSNPALTCKDTVCQSVTVSSTTTACGTASFSDYVYGDTSIHIGSTSTGVNDSTFYGYIVRNTATGNIAYSTSGYNLTFTSTPALHNGIYNVCLYLYHKVQSTLVVCDSTCSTITVGTVCGTPSFNYYIYSDTSIHAFSNSTGTTQSTIYFWTVKGANNNVIQSQMSTTNYFISQHLSPGVYTVCLTLYNGNIPCNDSVCNTVVVPIVGACGTPSFADSVVAGNAGLSIRAYTTSTSVDSAAQYIWKIWGPNGNLVQTFTGVNDFTSSTLDSGTYTVCQYIRATDATYICDSLCQTITVGNSNPCAGFSAAWTYNLQSNTTDSVEFHGASDPSGTYYRWTFGDGSYNYGQNITHGYAQSGTYDVCLVVFNSAGTCRDTVCHNITITTTTPCPVAAFSQYILSDTVIHAYSSSTGTTSATVYNWRVTNPAGLIVATYQNTGTTSSFYSPGLPNGTYNVCLFVSANSNTFCDSICQTITIANTINPCSGLNANFTTTTLQNGNVQFHPTDTSTGVTHYWHFGDGTVSTNNDPTHAYATAGTYHVCQYVYYTGITTCLDSFCTNIQVGVSGCSASFTSAGYYPNGIQFRSTSTSSDSIISYRWTFGDGSTATFASGDHVFNNSGTYNICLTITSLNGCSSTYCDSVNVISNPCSGLSANYTYTYTQSGGVHFAGSTNLTNVTNYWTFGDGTSATTFDPTHYYTQPGSYTVCHIVTVSGTLCSDTSCQTVQGTNVGTGCHANFTDSAYANAQNTIIFTNTSTSTDSIVSYAWSFGDGASSSDKNIYHTYATSGTYYVCLVITAANGCTNTYCDSIHVGTTTSPACHASFNYTIDSCQVVTFTSTSTGDLNFLRWIYGDGTTDTLSHPTHVYAQGGYFQVILHFYGVNCYNFDTAVIFVPSCSTSTGDTVCGTVFNDLNGNGVQNTGDAGIANAEVHIGNYVTHADSTGHYEIVVPSGTYTIYYCAPTGYSFTIPVHTPLDSTNTQTCSAYQNVQITSGSNCGYNFGIQANTITICGTVYFDANDNHVQDQSESGIPNAQVVFTDQGQVVYTGYTDQYGHYCAVLPVGTYVITVNVTNYAHGVVTPGSITVAATTSGGSYDNNSFGVYVPSGTCDLSINITPNTTVTPGYPAWYELEVCNVGSNVTSGTANLFYDPSLRYNYSSPSATSQNPTTYTATWNVSNLNPGSCQYYYVSFTADSNLVAGQFIFTLATVNTDSCPDANQGNNIDTVHQNVTASWDPNSKQVSPLGQGPQGLINSDQWLTYTISFQNTGTAPAINIVIEDTLSQFLDPATFKMLGSSLPYTMQFAGNVAIWKFNAVSLPDSAVDPQGSTGFVSFMILPLQGLPNNTAITNQADVYFDYNAGVATNRTLNTIDYTLSVNQIAASNVTITLQPNPFSQYTTVKVDGAEGPYELTVYDMLGREVKNQTAAGNIFNIDRGTLASGVYMYQVMHNGTVIGKGKMVAQ